MNRKAMVFLYICAIAFIIAIVTFYGSIGKQTPGGDTKLLGEKEIQLFGTYEQAEQDMYYIELAAQISAERASQENFQEEFEAQFAKYLEKKSITQEEYTFSYTESAGTMTIIGTAAKDIVYEEENYRYSLTPNFRVSIPFEMEGFIP